MKILIYQDKSGEWRWRMIAANGRKVATSGEGYTRKRDAVRAAKKFLKDVRLEVET